jgi:lipopolysaccharide biosynthesis glycosyltransferase
MDRRVRDEVETYTGDVAWTTRSGVDDDDDENDVGELTGLLDENGVAQRRRGGVRFGDQARLVRVALCVVGVVVGVVICVMCVARGGVGVGVAHVGSGMAETVHLAYSVCGSGRNKEAALSVKSAVSMTSSDTKYKIHVYTDNDKSAQIVTAIKARLGLPNVEFATHHVDSNEPLQHLFSLCSPNRLLIPAKLAELGVYKYIYVDTDTLWREDPKIAYNLMDSFGPEQVVGFAQENDAGKGGWYNNGLSPKIQFPKPTGLNAGVMFVKGGGEELTKGFREVVDTFPYPKGAFPLGDQDVINHFLSQHPNKLFRLPCKYNRRSDSYCQNPDDIQGGIMHGNRKIFHLQPGNPDYVAEYAKAWRTNKELDLKRRYFPRLRHQRQFRNRAGAH